MANASELSGKFVFVSDSFRSRSRAQICLLERVDSQSVKRGGFQAGRAKLNSDAITQDCASSSALSSKLTGAAGSQLCEVAGCHRVRRRAICYTILSSQSFIIFLNLSNGSLNFSKLIFF